MTAAAQPALRPVEDGALLARGLLAAGVLYPVWYLLTPDSAFDPWWQWAVVSLSMVLPAAAGYFAGLSARWVRILAHAAVWLQVAHFIILASLNEMHPFYAVGSVLMVLAPATVLASRTAYLAFSTYALSLALGSFLVEPQVLKVAYWGPLFLVLPFVGWQVTVRQRAEEGLRSYQATLEQRVRASTRRLTAAKERLEREIAERENAEKELRVWQKLESLSRLAGGVAHDFNNILTVIEGHSDFLLDTLPTGSSIRADAEQISQMVGRASRLTDQLRIFASEDLAETGALDLNTLAFQARPLLASVVGEDVDLLMELEPGGAWIHANRSQVEQVVYNLAVNARDAMPDGGQLLVQTESVSQKEIPAGILPLAPGASSERFVRFSVTDSGKGMDPETASRVFDPFFTTKGVGQGSGLGLAAAYGIVRRSGGHIRVESRPQYGTRFEILWPQVEAPEEKEPDESHFEASVRGECVLLVEDELSVRKVVTRLLEKWGYSVLEAEDAKSALQILETQSHCIDLLLTDVIMPGESGIDLAKNSRRLYPDIRVLLMSGQMNHPSLVVDSLPADLELIRKPFRANVLQGKVRDMLDGAVGAGSA